MLLAIEKMLEKEVSFSFERLGQLLHLDYSVVWQWVNHDPEMVRIIGKYRRLTTAKCWK